MDLQDMMYTFEEIGLSDIILPFLFIFLITYAVLSTLPLFNKVRNIDAMIAIVFGLYATIYAPFAPFLMNFVSGSLIMIVIIFFAILTVSMYLIFSKGDTPDAHLKYYVQKHAGTIVAIILIILLFILKSSLKSAGITYLDDTMNMIFEYIPGLIVILLIYYSIRWIVSAPYDTEKIIKEIQDEAKKKMERHELKIESLGEGPTDIPTLERQIFADRHLGDKLPIKQFAEVAKHFGISDDIITELRDKK